MPKDQRTLDGRVPNPRVEIAMEIAAADSSGLHAHERLSATECAWEREAFHAQILWSMQANAEHGSQRAT